jgi:succinate dehydrogenase / fumarate reductase iron-sulfur subunit
MPEYTLKIRRYSPETGEAAYWDDFTIELDGHRSVLDGILQARDRQDGSIGIRCSCRAAICGSCGVRINGKPTLACHTHLDKAAETAPDGAIVVEPMGNMPVLKDLIVDMDAVHWSKIQRVTPWLLPDGDPSDGQHSERLKDLAEDPHGIYDCTHCFNCIEACPKGVAPMSQIMRLRRVASDDHGIDDRNNGHRHEMAFVKNIEKNGLLHEADLLPDSYGGKFHPRAVPELLDSLPSILKALQRRKVTPAGALLHKHKAPKEVKRIFERVHQQDERFELNLYVTGYEDEEETTQ